MSAIVENLLPVAIGLVAGTAGYGVSTFWMQPVLKFSEIRYQVLREFIYFKQVIDSTGLNEEMQNLHRERILANRRTSAELAAATLQLPFWFKWYLDLKGYKPDQAAKHLIGYSNTTEFEKSHQIEAVVRKQLGLPDET